MKKKVKAKILKEGECPRCGSFNTFIRYRRIYEDQDIFQPSLPILKMEMHEFHCEDCKLIDLIYGRDDIKAIIKHLKNYLNTPRLAGKATIMKQIKEWQAIHDGAPRIPRPKKKTNKRNKKLS